MEPWEVLIVNHGLSPPFLKSGEYPYDNIEIAPIILNHRGIPDITRHYSAIILNWCWFSSIERSDKKEHRVSQDIQKVIKALQQHMRRLRISAGVPIIVASDQDTKPISSVSMSEALFLARRLLSWNEGHNERRIALVKRKVQFSKNVVSLMTKARRKYGYLDIIPQDLITFRETLFDGREHSDNAYDLIALHFGAKYVCAVDLDDLNEDLPPEEFEWLINAKLKKKSKRKRIEFSSEPELRDELGMETLWEECQKYKTVRCWPINEYEKVDELLLRSLVWASHPEINIPDFFDNCPKV